MNATDFYEVYNTPADVAAYAAYDEAAHAANVDKLGRAENPLDEQEQPDLVLAGFGCPACGENEADSLIVGDDDRITCATCGKAYELIVTPHFCHCGAVLNSCDVFECGDCTAEYQDWLNEHSERREAFGLF
jgi:transcription elongation factor Elf1